MSRSSKEAARSLSVLTVCVDLCECAVYSWGRGEDGQLGLGDTSDQHRPVLVDALQERRIVQIACGSGHTVVLTGTLTSWIGLSCLVWL